MMGEMELDGAHEEALGKEHTSKNELASRGSRCRGAILVIVGGSGGGRRLVLHLHRVVRR